MSLTFHPELAIYLRKKKCFCLFYQMCLSYQCICAFGKALQNTQFS